MAFSFDLYGFVSDTVIADRQTEVEPPAPDTWPAGKRPNWTGHEWVFLDWPPPIPLPAPRLIPVKDFRARFTDDEIAAILKLSYYGAGDVNAAMLLFKLQTSDEIDLDSQAVADGITYLISRGLIAPERGAEIIR